MLLNQLYIPVWKTNSFLFFSFARNVILIRSQSKVFNIQQKKVKYQGTDGNGSLSSILSFLSAFSHHRYSRLYQWPQNFITSTSHLRKLFFSYTYKEKKYKALDMIILQFENNVERKTGFWVFFISFFENKFCT